MDEILMKIDEKLDLIVKLLAFSYLKGSKTQKEKILALYDLKIKQKEIAEILGISLNIVTARVSENR